jgi:hypothetical protein
MIFLKSVLCLLLAGGFAQTDTIFKKEMGPLQSAVDVAITSTGSRIMSSPRATYLDDYGVLVSVEVALEAPPNPFDGFKTSDATRKAVNTRYKDLTTKLADLVKEQVAKIDSVGATESLSVVVYILNANPADAPNLPSQLVITMKKSGSEPSVRTF